MAHNTKTRVWFRTLLGPILGMINYRPWHKFTSIWTLQCVLEIPSPRSARAGLVPFNATPRWQFIGTWQLSSAVVMILHCIPIIPLSMIQFSPDNNFSIPVILSTWHFALPNHGILRRRKTEDYWQGSFWWHLGRWFLSAVPIAYQVDSLSQLTWW